MMQDRSTDLHTLAPEPTDEAQLALQQQVTRQADQLYQWAPDLAAPMQTAMQLLLASITGGGTAWVAGLGQTQAVAMEWVRVWTQGLDRPRPPLSAWRLDTQNPASGGAWPWLQQMQCSARSGDVLVLLHDDVRALERHPQHLQTLAEAVESAHERDVLVLALCAVPAARALQDWMRLLHETDALVLIPSPHAHSARVWLMVLVHTLATAVDRHLLGEDGSAQSKL